MCSLITIVSWPILEVKLIMIVQTKASSVEMDTTSNEYSMKIEIEEWN